MVLAKKLENSMIGMDRCDMGMPANGAVAFSIFSFFKNAD